MRYIDAYAGNVVEFVDVDTDDGLVFREELCASFGARGMLEEMNPGEDVRLEGRSALWEVGYGMSFVLFYGESESGSIVGVCFWNVIFQ